MATPIANVEMAAAWDGEEGEGWAREWERYDRSIRRYHDRLFAAAAIAPSEYVLDIGCGTGESTRAAGRAAPRGAALGVDLSTAMIESARELAGAEGLLNVSFERTDAQVHPFNAGAYDVVISRFGAMFFLDRRAAFRNMWRASRAGGRLVMLGWQELRRNEWLQGMRAALSAGRDLPSPALGSPGPFGLADRDGVERDLVSAGFERVEISGVEELVCEGADAEDAYRFLCSTGMVRGLLQDLDGSRRAAALSS